MSFDELEEQFGGTQRVLVHEAVVIDAGVEEVREWLAIVQETHVVLLAVAVAVVFNHEPRCVPGPRTITQTQGLQQWFHGGVVAGVKMDERPGMVFLDGACHLADEGQHA